MEEKTKILCTSVDLFMKYGIKSISMDDISRDLGMSKKTLYKHFKSKKDLIHEVVQMHQETELNMMLSIRKMKVNAIEEMLKITSYVRQILRGFRPTVMYDLQKYHKSLWKEVEAESQKNIYHIIMENVSRGQSEGLYRPELNSKIIGKLYTTISLALVRDPLSLSDEVTMEDTYVEFINYHLHAIATEKGKQILANKI